MFVIEVPARFRSDDATVGLLLSEGELFFYKLKQQRTIGLLLAVTDDSTTCVVVIFRVNVSCITSVDGINSGY